jgi:uncharacterized protein YdaU (DUF1376 family)
MPWFPLYCGDLLKDTMHLNATEFGVYSLFLTIIYSTGRPLPSSDEQLRMMARLPTGANWTDIRRTVLEHYFYETPLGWFKDKCGEVMTEQAKKARKQSEAGRKGAQARWSEERADDNDPYGIAEANANANANAQTKPCHPDSDSDSHPDSKSHPHPKPQPERLAYKGVAQEKPRDEDNFPVTGETWEQNLMRRCRSLFPGKEMGLNGGLWRGMARRDPDTLNRVLLEIGTMRKEGTPIENLPACAMDLYKRFGGKPKK